MRACRHHASALRAQSRLLRRRAGRHTLRRAPYWPYCTHSIQVTYCLLCAPVRGRHLPILPMSTNIRHSAAQPVHCGRSLAGMSVAGQSCAEHKLWQLKAAERALTARDGRATRLRGQGVACSTSACTASAR